MEPVTIPSDILLRLALSGRFVARDLSALRSAFSPSERARSAPEGGMDATGAGAARAAASSRKAADRARAVEDACARAGAGIVSIEDDEYPGLLRNVADAPLVLFRRGRIPPTDRAVAIVGSRVPTGAGRDFARALAFGLARAGWTVVSGLARGIDAAAHEGALRGGGLTVAALGCGVDVAYPPEHRELSERIAGAGAVLSEFPPGTPPLPGNFPRRNRLISGMARGVVVAEARRRSGALITARLALDQGREVMAVPGNPLHPQTEGSNGLLRDGATPVTDPADVLAALGWGGAFAAADPEGTRKGEGGPPGCGGAGEGAEILDFLGTEEKHLNDIAARLGIPVPALLARLLDLELRKLLERLPGDYYKKMSHFPG